MRDLLSDEGLFRRRSNIASQAKCSFDDHVPFWEGFDACPDSSIFDGGASLMIFAKLAFSFRCSGFLCFHGLLGKLTVEYFSNDTIHMATPSGLSMSPFSWMRSMTVCTCSELRWPALEPWIAWNKIHPHSSLSHDLRFANSTIRSTTCNHKKGSARASNSMPDLIRVSAPKRRPK